ncbi:hypothetical protein KM043_014710 [Ampulex compressa]|nr:hypothetical protein KM043_014710 [Ampulex compressa]
MCHADRKSPRSYLLRRMPSVSPIVELGSMIRAFLRVASLEDEATARPLDGSWLREPTGRQPHAASSTWSWNILARRLIVRGRRLREEWDRRSRIEGCVREISGKEVLILRKDEG